MNYEQALSYIHSLLVFGSQPGLERITELLECLGNPQDNLKFIHVAGTNGKGSTCHMLAEVYKAAGLKTGLYTSPYVVDFRERMQINGEYIDKEDLARLCERVKATGITVTEFEFITALAMLWFYEQKCDVVVLEVGLGGRFDATNVIKKTLCSVIMKIDLDHTAVLGDTVEQIAFEKCGIIKNGTPTVSYPLQDNKALGVIKEQSDKLIIPETKELFVISSSVYGNAFAYKGRSYRTRLVGKHQMYNAITVIETVMATEIDVDVTAISDGIANATVPARLELINENPIVFLDGAHNPNGADALSGFMKQYNGNIVGVAGMMADKNCDGFLKEVLKHCSSLITVTVKENPRSMSAEDLAQMASSYIEDVTVADNYDTAIEIALKKSGNKKPIFVFGSLYLAGAVRPKLISKLNP